MKVQLIQTLGTVRGSETILQKSAPPLGLLSIATYLQDNCEDVEVEVLDGAITPLDEIESRLDADLVGFSTTLWNYPSSLELAQTAKERGAIVVMGGHHATMVAKNIVRNREYVDYAVCGDGEVPMLELVRKKPVSEIPSLVYRNNGHIAANHTPRFDLNDYPIPSRAFVEMKPYFDCYCQGMPDSPFDHFTTIYSHKGCSYKIQYGPCIFCGIANFDYRTRAPRKIWEELEQLYNEYGVFYVMDAGDNLTKEWLKQFVAANPRRHPHSFTSYIRASEVDEEYADLLQSLNCYSVFVGVESGDAERLRAAKKGTCPEDNLRAARILQSRGIKVRLGIVLNLPGETSQSLERTIDHIKHLLDVGNIEGLSCAHLVPLPGSRAFARLAKLKPSCFDLIGQDRFDPGDLEKYWSQAFTSVPYEHSLQVQSLIRSMAAPVCQ